MLHGLLHLAGYDHERDNGLMARREQVLRTRLKLPRGLIERSGDPTLSPEKRRQDGARKVSVKRVAKAASAQDDGNLNQDDGRLRNRRLSKGRSPGRRA